MTNDEIWKFWWARPAVADGEDDSMEAEFVAAVRRALAAAQALAEPEPVAWRRRFLKPDGPWSYSGVFTHPNPGLGPQETQPLYTSPPAQAPAEVASKGVRDALETLVSLKDLKESIATAPNANEAHRRDAEYRRLRPFAWIEARRVLATPTQPPPTAAAIEQAPEGFVLVPREATPLMEEAGEAAFFAHPQRSRADWAAICGAAYTAMLAAVPTYPAPVLANGLTEAETAASMSVQGLSRPALTEEQIIAATIELDCDRPGWVIRFARAIEAAIRTEGKTE